SVPIFCERRSEARPDARRVPAILRVLGEGRRPDDESVSLHDSPPPRCPPTSPLAVHNGPMGLRVQRARRVVRSWRESRRDNEYPNAWRRTAGCLRRKRPWLMARPHRPVPRNVYEKRRITGSSPPPPTPSNVLTSTDARHLGARIDSTQARYRTTAIRLITG